MANKRKTQAELLVEMTEEAQTRKILDTIMSCKDLAEATAKVKAMIAELENI